MKLKDFLILIYGVASLLLAIFTAAMTYLIIDEPIGMKMLSKITLTVLATLPVIALLSYFLGSYLSKKFSRIRHCLDSIHQDQFLQDSHHERLSDIAQIHDAIHHLSKRLQSSIDELKRNNHHLNAMILSLSHDIKTPLTIIDGYLEEIADGLIDSDKLPQTIVILQKETHYLNELSSEAIAYIKSLESVPHQESINLYSFITQEILPLIPIKPTIELHCDIDPQEIIHFHPLALKKILLNLLDNANKFTPSGSIKIYSDHQTISIEDSGIGIDASASQEIFKPFVSLDESKNRKYGGFGLGLSIAKNLALSNGYDVRLDTRYTEGSRFVLFKSTL